MVIQIDTREHQKAIQNIIQTMDVAGIMHISSKLYVGDYMLYGYPDLVIDRKHNLGELAGNICGKQHERFANELKRAKEVGTHIIVLVEDDNIKSIEDVKKWSSKHTKVKGETLYKAMMTMQSETEKYDVEFQFCKKRDTGMVIVDRLVWNMEQKAIKKLENDF